MDKPVKLRPKPIDVEAMPYTGENAEAIFRWVLTIDPMSTYRQSAVLPSAHLGLKDGATSVPVVPYLEIHTFSYAIRIWKGQWLVLTEGVLKPLMDNYVQEKYDLVWPEPLNI